MAKKRKMNKIVPANSPHSTSSNVSSTTTTTATAATTAKQEPYGETPNSFSSASMDLDNSPTAAVSNTT